MPDARRLSLLAVTLVAVAACQTGAGSSPTPDPGGTHAGGSASPSASPTASVGAVDHPTESSAVVLRMEQVGGFVPQEFNATRLPAFTLYGDGTVVYQGGDAPSFEPGAARAPLRTAHMTEDQVQALLAFALGRGGLLDARRHYPNPLVADAPSTVFTVNAGGVNKQVTIDALAEGEPSTTEDVNERRAFSQLARALSSFDTAVESGEATAGGDYEPTAYRGVLIEAVGMEGELRDWPWTDLAPEDFVQDDQLGFRTAELTPEQAAAVVDDPRGGVMSVLVSGPDRAPYSVNIRPLLADEIE